MGYGQVSLAAPLTCMGDGQVSLVYFQCKICFERPVQASRLRYVTLFISLSLSLSLSLPLSLTHSLTHSLTLTLTLTHSLTHSCSL